jgi:hypothetical protein
LATTLFCAALTGTAEDLDAELSTTIVGFVGSHLQMKNTLEKATAEMDAASKAAQSEARSKSKTPTKSAPPKADSSQPAAASKPIEQTKPSPPKTASLFDVPTPASTPTFTHAESEEEPESWVKLEDDEPGGQGQGSLQVRLKKLALPAIAELEVQINPAAIILGHGIIVGEQKTKLSTSLHLGGEKCYTPRIREKSLLSTRMRRPKAPGHQSPGPLCV